MVYLLYNFEFHPAKSEANRHKHGIDFMEARKIWDDPFSIELPTEFKLEHRFLAVGEINGKCWTAVITYREENIRIVSVRRSRKKEIEAYEQKKDEKNNC